MKYAKRADARNKFGLIPENAYEQRVIDWSDNILSVQFDMLQFMIDGQPEYWHRPYEHKYGGRGTCYLNIEGGFSMKVAMGMARKGWLTIKRINTGRTLLFSDNPKRVTQATLTPLGFQAYNLMKKKLEKRFKKYQSA